MLKLKNNKIFNKKTSELEIFLSTGMEVYSSQNVKKQNKKIKNKNNDEKSIDFDKIDDLIANYEKTKKIDNKNIDQEKKDKKPYLEFVEIRDTSAKKPQTSELNNEKKLPIEDKTKKSIEGEKEIIFNVKDDDSKTKEITFNFSEKDDKEQKVEKKDKKRFFIFKSKKNKKDEVKKIKEDKIDKKKELKNKKIKEKNKKLFSKKKKSNKKSDDTQNTKKLEDDLNIKEREIQDNEKTFLDEDIKKVLLITDSLLEKLPEEVINEFIKSKDFELYERVINKIK
jgi:hypothetical protein